MYGDMHVMWSFVYNSQKRKLEEEEKLSAVMASKLCQECGCVHMRN